MAANNTTLSLSDVFEVVAVIFWSLAAFFEFRDRAQSPEEREKTRAWYAHKWAVIRDRELLRLPETVVRWAIGRFQAIGQHAERLMGWLHRRTLIVRAAVFPLLGLFAVWQLWESPGRWYLLVPYMIVYAFMVPPQELEGKGTESQFRAIARITATAGLVSVLLTLISFCILLQSVLRLNIALATAATLLLVPVTTVTIAASLEFAAMARDMINWRIGLWSAARFWLLGLSIAVSFPLTMVSLAFGRAIVPDAPVPKTLQLMLSNVFFDGSTVLATLIILKAAIDSKGKFPLWLAVPCDLAVAAVLACLSLWLGLLFTKNEISFVDTICVLWGRSPGNNTFQLGPYFWAMHTTFLPTCFYLGVIASCYAGKLVILPIAFALRKGVAVEKPHSLTAALLAFIGAVFLVLSWAVRILELKRGAGRS